MSIMGRIKRTGQIASIFLLLAFIISYTESAANVATIKSICNYHINSKGICYKHITNYSIAGNGCSLTNPKDLGDFFAGNWCRYCGEGLMLCGHCESLNKYVGGCNANNMYYECSEVYQNVSAFSGTFPDMSEWWYFNSTDGNGQHYKCLDVYNNSSNKTVQHRTSDYHTIEPSGRSDCLNDEAFQTFNNTICDQQQNAFNTGIYTVYNDPAYTYQCSDDDGNNLDDVTGESCAFTRLPRPEDILPFHCRT